MSREELAELAVEANFRILKPAAPPIDLEDDQSLSELLAETTMPVVILFHAKWCSVCITLSPVFRAWALKVLSLLRMRQD